MWRRLLYYPEINYGLRQTIILCLPIAISLLFNDLRSGLLFSLVPACCNIAGLDTPHRHFFKRLIIGGLLFSSAVFLTQIGLQLAIPLPAILLILALSFGIVNEISALDARLLPASLIAAIFTLSLPNSVPGWHLAILYVAGVLWYGIFTYFWFKLWQEQPVRDLLCRLYQQIADHSEIKYNLLINNNEIEKLVPELLKKQQSVMDTEVLIYQQLQMMKGIQNSQYKHLLRSFQVALDLQEHISVSWHQPDEVQKLINQTPIDLIIKHNAHLIVKRLRSVADDIQYHRKSTSFSMRNETIALTNIAQQHPDNEVGKFYVYHFSRIGRLLRSLVPLYNRSLVAEQPRLPLWRCIINYLSFKSPSLRNAGRIGITLAIASLLGGMLDLPKPFWILLTIMFVSQNGYNATRVRIQHRAIGTLFGLLMAAGILTLPFSQDSMLLIMLLITLISYFIVRKNYAIAVIGFTTTAVYTLQLITHDGADFLLARMLDTIIGCLLAFVSTIWLWPQWQSDMLRKNAFQALECYQHHLRLLLNGNQSDNESSYSCMRLNQAHNTLASSLNQAMQEPGFNSQYLTDMRLWVSHSQFVTEHLNAITILMHDHYKISPDLAKQYLTECEIALQVCQQRLQYDSSEQKTNTISAMVPETYSANIMVHHLKQILYHLDIMSTISAIVWNQHAQHNVSLLLRLPGHFNKP